MANQQTAKRGTNTESPDRSKKSSALYVRAQAHQSLEEYSRQTGLQPVQSVGFTPAKTSYTPHTTPDHSAALPVFQ